MTKTKTITIALLAATIAVGSAHGQSPGWQTDRRLAMRLRPRDHVERRPWRNRFFRHWRLVRQ
jgi:hypothetical protein